MKRIAVVFALLLTVWVSASAIEDVVTELSDAQRYDLADAYDRVAERFDELGQTERAQGYHQMAQVIFPNFGETERPEEEIPEAVDETPVVVERPTIDPAGENASRYYFSKLLRGIFTENVSLCVSVMAEVIYLPYYDSGVDRTFITEELEWFFGNYETLGWIPDDVFDMDSITVRPLDNGFWRLDIEVRPEFVDSMDNLTFWSAKQGYYFRKYAEGWRLAAIGPVS